MLKRWFTRKYNLPATHPAYTCLPEGEWLEEWYTDLYADQEQALYALQNLGSSGASPKEQEAERRRINADLARIAAGLGESVPSATSDPILDDIEARMARGETDIDMSVLMPKGWKPPPQ